jgi:hypothetical protein
LLAAPKLELHAETGKVRQRHSANAEREAKARRPDFVISLLPPPASSWTQISLV